MLKALPDMFSSPVVPPKRLGHASEAMLHVLEVRKLGMYIRILKLFYRTIQRVKWWAYFLFVCLSVYRRPNTFLQTRPLSSPVVVVCETNCILAIGTMPVLVFTKEDIYDCVMYLMACYYAFHLTYPKCNTPVCAADRSPLWRHPRPWYDFFLQKGYIEWKKFTE